MKAYPSAEWGGYIWVYMGPADKRPPLPEFEWATLPPEHRWQKKWHYNANYMQGFEGEIDTGIDLTFETLHIIRVVVPLLLPTMLGWQGCPFEFR